MVLVHKPTLKEFQKKNFKHLEQQTEAFGSYFQGVSINMDLEFCFHFEKVTIHVSYLLCKALYTYLVPYILFICRPDFGLYIKCLQQVYGLKTLGVSTISGSSVNISQCTLTGGSRSLEVWL